MEVNETNLCMCNEVLFITFHVVNKRATCFHDERVVKRDQVQNYD